MFYFAQKAVLHPSLPLWNYQDKDLTEPCKKALTMIFKICDIDNDGVMSDEELGRFQRKCFNMDLELGTLDSLKTVVMKNCPEGILGSGLTLKGFLTLNSLFIQRGRHETTWTILRKFGYNDNIELEPDALVPPISSQSGSVIELTHAGTDFLLQVFMKHDKDGDGALSPQELVSLFSTCPSMPWGPEIYHQVVTNSYGWIGRPGYIALWHLKALLNPEKCRQTLAYLGYDYLSPAVASKPSPLALTKDKPGDMAKQHQSSKSVYSCLVIGPRDAGKTTFCQTFLGRDRDSLESIPESDIPNAVINSVTVYGQLKHLVLIDKDLTSHQDELNSLETNCDVVCLVYDVSNPRSFELCARLYLRYFSGTEQPVLLVGNKSEFGHVKQDYIMQPEVFCSKHKLPPPQFVSCIRGQSNKEIFIKLVTMAAFPKFPAAWMIFYRGRHLTQLSLLTNDEAGLIRLGVGVAALALGGAFAFKYFQGNR
eukprot:TRINITY_DN35243_c0_g1_i2.p1 TRINITY_DN35243_c0_g1~~TRINITY_DN35243_c0_g1_i2.p1  ORF type:complete len:508 (-),score=61.70 TRINITY_DN35243_c0_g1_i2:215-1657(-)